MRQNNYYRKAQSQMRDAKESMQGHREEMRLGRLLEAVEAGGEIKEKGNRRYYWSARGNRYYPLSKGDYKALLAKSLKVPII